MPADKLSEADYQELSKYRQPYAPSQEEYARFVGLKKRGFLKIHHFGLVHLGELGDHMAPDTWFITPAGEDALSEFEKARRKESEDKRQQRFQNQISVAQVLVPLITFILGLVVEHYAGLISGLSEFLGRWVK